MLKDEIDSLAPGRDFSRRGFVQTAVGSGFAAAVLPVTAQTLTTDSAGLEAGSVSIAVGDFQMPAYRAAPAGGRNLPVVLVACEIFGVHEHIADVCRRLAKQGKLVLPAILAEEPVFASLVVCDTPPAVHSYDGRAADEGIRIIIGEVRLELAADTPAVRLAEIVRALGAAPC